MTQLETTSQPQKAETPSVEDNEFLSALLGEDPAVLNKDTTAAEKPQVKDGAEKPTEPVRPRSIAEVAERLGLKVEEVYELEVPLTGDGQKMTIGRLKDSISELKAFEGHKLAFEEEKVKFENGATRAKDELSTIVKRLKDVIPPQHFESVMKAGRDEYTAKLNEERAKVFEFIPEWQDKDTLAKEVEEINNFLEPYFGKKAFSQFNNAKMIKLLRDTTKRELRVRQAIAKMTEVTPTAKAASKKTPVQTDTRRSSGKTQDPRKAFVDGLFK